MPLYTYKKLFTRIFYSLNISILASSESHSLNSSRVIFDIFSINFDIVIFFYWSCKIIIFYCVLQGYYLRKK